VCGRSFGELDGGICLVRDRLLCRRHLVIGKNGATCWQWIRAGRGIASPKGTAMDNPPTLDELFRSAVSAIDSGDVIELERLVTAHPTLVRDRLQAPGSWLRDQVGNALDGFFKQPYLLWFVAEDPVRHGTLPANIADITRVVIRAAEREGVETLQEQLDHALRLVSWSWIARDCNVQIALVDVLLDAGATPDGNPENALVNSNFAAAAHLVERGARLTLATALCLARWDDVRDLGATASARDRQFAFVLAALKGKAEALAKVIALGVDLNAPCADLYSHATALHHAVSSGSLEAVTVLVEAGASLDAKDTAYGGTPLDWAEYGKHVEIAKYLHASRSGLSR
jgi:Ankyrin repeats (3 copies)